MKRFFSPVISPLPLDIAPYLEVLLKPLTKSGTDYKPEAYGIYFYKMEEFSVPFVSSSIGGVSCIGVSLKFCRGGLLQTLGLREER